MNTNSFLQKFRYPRRGNPVITIETQTPATGRAEPDNSQTLLHTLRASVVKSDSTAGFFAQAQPVVLVTGASQGLGRAFSEAWARRGAALLLAALPGSGLPQAAEELRQRYGVPVETLEIDLTAPGSLERLEQWVAASGRPLSVLVNNAGVGYNSRFEDSTVQENEACILLNNLALVKITRLLLPALKRQPRAYILNVSSLAAFFPMPFMPVYAPSKAFILNFSLALREEMRGSGVNVSALCPNGILTNPETRRQIAAGGWAARLTCQEAETVAEYALEHLLAGQAVIVPGWLNRIIMTAGKYIPRAVIYGVIGAFWGKTARPHRETPAYEAGVR